MKLIRLMTLAAASCIAGTTFAISDTPVSPAEAEKIKTSLEAFGCTADEMEKSESSVLAFEVDDAKCKDGECTTEQNRIVLRRVSDRRRV